MSKHSQSSQATAPAATNSSRGTPTRAAAFRAIGIGVALLAAGILVTVLTYRSAESSPSGGTYVVAWGPMLFGALIALRGALALAKSHTRR